MADTPDFDTIKADLDSLKRDFAALISHLKIGDRIGDAAEQVGGEAARVYGMMSDHGDRSVKAVQRQMQEQPVLFLLGVFAVGFLSGRASSR